MTVKPESFNEIELEAIPEPKHKEAAELLQEVKDIFLKARDFEAAAAARSLIEQFCKPSESAG